MIDLDYRSLLKVGDYIANSRGLYMIAVRPTLTKYDTTNTLQISYVI